MLLRPMLFVRRRFCSSMVGEIKATEAVISPTKLVSSNPIIRTQSMMKGRKRFYKEVSVRRSAVFGQYNVFLDERRLRSPHGTLLEMPAPVAHVVAMEWDAQIR